MTLYPTYGKPRSLDAIRRMTTFRGLHPTMQKRVGGLIEASGGAVGLGEGRRAETLQLRMFLDRHEEDPSGTIWFRGRSWRRLPGRAPAAPPGRSMHELGLAADLVGDFGWVGENAARFDLQTFANVNDEPWHVQPVELPRGRKDYEKTAAWGTPPWTGEAEGTTPTADTPLTLTPAYTVSSGDSGAAAGVLEEALIARELLADDDGARDATYGDDDEALVRNFQSDERLYVDGIVGPRTWGALLRVIRPDDRGPDVRVLQSTLIARSMVRDTDANRDGVYGPATQETISQFQEAAGLGVDGIDGPATWTGLIGEKKRVTVTRGEPVDADDDADDDLDWFEVLRDRDAD